MQKPSTSNTIVSFRDRKPSQGVLYEAEYVRRSIRKNYRLDD